MKPLAVTFLLLIVVLGGLLHVPALQGSAHIFVALIILLAIVATVLVSRLGSGEKASAPTPVAAPAPTPAPAPVPVPAASTAEAEIVAFLGLLQEKGRLVDFLMDDITPYQDAQVGAAARVVHQGCRNVLSEHFKIAPVCPAEEGSQVTVPLGAEAARFRLVGRIAGEPPFTGALVHKGWKTDFVKLPRLAQAPPEGLLVIVPAEVELR